MRKQNLWAHPIDRDSRKGHSAYWGHLLFSHKVASILKISAKMCGPGPHIANAWKLSESTRSGGEVTYSCNPGYQLADSQNNKLVCTDMEWVGTWPSCGKNSIELRYEKTRWSISIGISLHLHTDGDMSYRHLCRNLNQSRLEENEITNTATGQ